MRKYEKGPKKLIETTAVFSISIPIWQVMKLEQETRDTGLSRSALISRMLTSYLGNSRPIVFAGEGSGLSDEETARFKAIDDELKEETKRKKEEEEAHKRTMSELLPPPEQDPDLKGA